ncbi:blr1606 [Bradyrhizobium diazoefficiens USDA 110]|uniref:Blr1606 protein n=1 Tax=Bradyrhizobium diazoefficiens (strain JCM 10833 / BCRC 13528 / IAM 13628 / NBRC 14792 / USDA 110) TaxID=224911 RepID=Q89U14_BRADU|nr:hypothetical protein [Bradyrhizobium japonicum]PDT55692.1 hypothetical protein CO678_42490 [Bradyrhizobium diazoefficiens]QBP20521.1 hypothetical protein Bdiaspc4_08100 [Bradyrhizobium diazoefficiens]BAC46871.1 blr1606 [Bradyrhizobium diazoefficiens USDA 110]
MRAARSLTEPRGRLVKWRRFRPKRLRIRVLAGFAVTGHRPRERLAAPAAEIRDAQTLSSGVHWRGPDKPLRQNHHKIIGELEAGHVPWVQSWGSPEATACLAMPRSATTGRQHSGLREQGSSAGTTARSLLASRAFCWTGRG